jgi:hypothetical protein
LGCEISDFGITEQSFTKLCIKKATNKVKQKAHSLRLKAKQKKPTAEGWLPIALKT